MRDFFKKVFSWNESPRVWQMPFFAAAGIGVALLFGGLIGRIDLGLLGAIGASAFLYVPNSPMSHKMAVVMSVGFGIILCFALGVFSQLIFGATSAFNALCVGIIASSASIVVRYYDIGAPGYFFFVFACILGTFLPFSNAFEAIGAIALGAMVAAFFALLYSLSALYILKNKPAEPVPPRGKLGYEIIIADSLIMGVVVGVAMLIGIKAGLDRGYWVAVSAAAMLQGATLFSIWVKITQRILGTILGTFLAAFLLSVTFDIFSFALVMMILMWITEWVVLKNYAVAMIFVTPYTTYLAEMTSDLSGQIVLNARLGDIFIGCVLGIIGGFIIFTPRLKRPFIAAAKAVFRV